MADNRVRDPEYVRAKSRRHYLKRKAWIAANPSDPKVIAYLEHRNAVQLSWRLSHKEHLLRYKQGRAEIDSALSKQRRAVDPKFRITTNLRTRLYIVIRKALGKKSNQTFKLLGCSVESFMIYLESLFEPGMSWDNYGNNGWEIDHVVPCALFDLSTPAQQAICFHFSNLQPMWMSENRSKKSKVGFKTKHQISLEGK